MACGENFAYDAGGFDSWADVVHADDGCAVKNGNDESGDARSLPRLGWNRFVAIKRGERMAEEGFARDPGK